MVGKNVQYNHNVVVAFSATGQAQITQAFQQSNTALLGYQRNLQTVNTQLTNSSKANSVYQQAVTQSTGTTKTFSAGLAPVTKDITTFNNNIGSSAKPLQNFGNQAVTAGEKFKNFGSAMKGNILNFGILAAGITGLRQDFIGLEKAQVMNERTGIMMDRSNQKVVKTQKQLNDMIAKGEQGSTAYNIKLKDLAIAQDAARVATERHELTERVLQERTEEFWTQIIPNVILVGTSAISMLTNMGLNMKMVTGLLPAMKEGFLAMAGAEDTAALSARGLAFALGTIAAPLLTLKAVMDILPKVAETLKNQKIIADPMSGPVERLKARKAEIEHMLQSFDFTNMDTWATSMTNLFATITGGESKSELETELKLINEHLAGYAKIAQEADQENARLTTSMTNVNRAAGYEAGTINQTKESATSMADEFADATIENDAVTKSVVTLDDKLAAGQITVDEYLQIYRDSKKDQLLEYQIQNTKGVSTQIQDLVKQVGTARNIFKPYYMTLADGTKVLVDQNTVYDKGADAVDRYLENAKKADAAQQEINQTMKEFTQINPDFAKVFDVKLPKDDKFTKLLTKLLPDKLKKKVELQLELSGKATAFKDQLTNWLGTILQNTTIPDKDADKLGKAILDAMDKTFGKGKEPKELAGLREAVQNAVAAPDTGDKLKQIINEIKMDKPIEVPVVFTTDKAFGKKTHSGFFNGGLFLGNATDKDLQGPTVTVTADLDTSQADPKITQLQSDIDGLSKSKPEIGLQNTTAVQKVADTKGRITQLTTFKPYVNLQNDKAVQKVDDVKGRINALSDLHPTVTVTVKYDTSGKPAGVKQHGGSFIANAMHGADIITRPTTIDGTRVGEHSKPELITVTPLTNSSNVADTTLKLKTIGGGSDSGLKQFMGDILDAIMSIKMNPVFHVNGSDIVQTKDVFASVSPLMGKNMVRYGSN